ncbi:Cilia- and flagella-associated protein 52 [Acropora cervicornis]|uniref:Cilia- and flagella-associated protein 52 n=1 Tax=Acropora cervicornis TaxID=6130 RepID=A0AAD9QN13_ACRCE|nr:Cilia- and flagella-associated protein 52 [Acropora cervicornis]
MSDIKPLDLHAIIGFAGEVQGGLLVNSDREHLIYPLGNTIVVEEIKEDRKEEAGVGVKKKYSTSPEDPKWRQKLLSGHRGAVSCLAVSKSGKYLASGEKTHMGFQADVIIWDFECGTIMHTLYPQLHKVKVISLVCGSVTFVELSKLLASNPMSSEPEPQLLFDGHLVFTSTSKKTKKQIKDIVS